MFSFCLLMYKENNRIKITVFFSSSSLTVRTEDETIQRPMFEPKTEGTNNCEERYGHDSNSCIEETR